MNWYETYGITKPYYSDDAVCIVHGDCREVLPLIPDKSIDLVLTSPPYDNLREYGGSGFVFNGLPRVLHIAMKEGACCVWIVGDQSVNGSERYSHSR